MNRPMSSRSSVSAEYYQFHARVQRVVLRLPPFTYHCHLSMYLPADVVCRVRSRSESSKVEYESLSNDREDRIRKPASVQ